MSVHVDPIRALERSPYFRGLSLSTLHGLSMFVDERSFRAGEVLLARGAAPESILLVCTGELVSEGNGDASLGPGALVGHMDMVSGQPAGLTLTAKSAGIALEFGGADVRRLIEDRSAAGSAFRRALILSLSDQLRAANQSLRAYLLANPQAARPSRGFLDELTGVLSGARTPAERKR